VVPGAIIWAEPPLLPHSLERRFRPAGQS